ncbi:MAG: acetylornithine deacetylase [Pararhodobacter sp.]
MATARVLELLERLVGFETLSGGDNLALVAFVEGHLTGLGFTLHRLSHPDGNRAGIFAALGPPGPGVMLSAHGDVVPVAGQNWTRPPFRLTIEGGRLYGRGTTDMKGYLACMLALAEAAATRPLREPLKLAISYDEEIGCQGMQRMIGALAPCIGLPRLCLVGEPTQMGVAIGHKGKAALRARFTGRAGHSALAPAFLNALYLAADFVQALRAEQAHWQAHGARDPAYAVPYTTLHAGRLQGGQALNIVPGSAELEFEYRHLAADAPAEIEARLERAAQAVCTPHRAEFPEAVVELSVENAYPGLDVAPDAPMVGWLQGLGAGPALKVPFGTEAGYFAAQGIDTLVCGPGSMAGQGHQPDEYVERAELAACEALLGRLLEQLTA